MNKNLENKSKFILNKINDITFIDNSKNQFINQHIDKPIFKVYSRNNPKKTLIKTQNYTRNNIKRKRSINKVKRNLD